VCRLTSAPWFESIWLLCSRRPHRFHTHLGLLETASSAAQDWQHAMANVPKPGPATLTPGAGLDEWLEEAKQCHYLPESVMKQLCEMVKEVLMEGSSPCLPHDGFC
jgi:hypothetical protein